jgi:hypothetical protein
MDSQTPNPTTNHNDITSLQTRAIVNFNRISVLEERVLNLETLALQMHEQVVEIRKAIRAELAAMMEDDDAIHNLPTITLSQTESG